MIRQEIIFEDDGLIERLQATPEIVDDEARTFLEIVTAHLVRLVKARTPVGTTGILRSSIFSPEITGFAANLRGVVTSPQPHAPTIENGRSPGSSLPPPGTLVTWIQRKFGVDLFEAEKLEFGVARNIAKFGFLSIPKGARMFAKALKQAKSFIARQGTEMSERIAKRIDNG